AGARQYNWRRSKRGPGRHELAVLLLQPPLLQPLHHGRPLLDAGPGNPILLDTYKVIWMGKSNVVYLCVWSGDAKHALDLTASQYPGLEIREFPQRRLRINGLAERIRLLRGFRGQAVIFFFESLADFKHRQVLVCFQLLPRCQATVLCDNRGHWEAIPNIAILGSSPAIARSLFLDAG